MSHSSAQLSFLSSSLFFFNLPATTHIYTLSYTTLFRSSDTLVKTPGGPSVRPDPCFQGGTGTGVGRIVSGPDYRVGPGDVVEVQFVGRLDVTRQQLVVDPEGVISIPPIGTVKIGGLSLRGANRRVAEHARQ